MAGKGTIRERSPGTWQLRVYLGRDAQGKPIQVGRFFKGGKRQAQAELARPMVEVERRTAPLEGPVTVAQLLERWLEHITPLREPGTVRGTARVPRQSSPIWAGHGSPSWAPKNSTGPTPAGLPPASRRRRSGATTPS